MYKIVLVHLNRWFEEKTVVEHVLSTKDQAERLFDGKHAIKSREDVLRRIVYDESGNKDSPEGKLIEEKRY